jgi:hypothetical protein
VRRVLLFIAGALVLGGLYGAHAGSAAVSVNGQAISASVLTNEITTINKTPVLQCYLGALARNGFQSGAGGATVGQSAASTWANLRITGLVIHSYVANQLHFVPTAAQRTNAQNTFTSELGALAAQYGLKCPGTAAQALAAMPAELRQSEIRDQADSLYLLGQLKSTVPLTPATLVKYYQAHRHNYQTVCVSIAIVPATLVPAFLKGEAAGESVATLARNYSKDPSAKKGGAYGCYAPSSSSYAVVTADVKGVALGHWTKPISFQNGTYGLFVSPTSRSLASYASVAPLILKTLQTANGSSAQKIEQALLYYSRVSIDSATGVWANHPSGSGVAAPAVPPKADVPAAALLSATTSPSYQ